VLHYLARHLGELYRATGDTSFSLIVRAELDGLSVTDSVLFAGPFPWQP
jgi:hypothetical protein